MKNTVAQILKGYAWMNGIAGLIFAIAMANSLDGLLIVLWFLAVVLVSFFIYAFGEVIELLYQIKSNTDLLSQIKKNVGMIADNSQSVDDELPRDLGGLFMSERYSKVFSLPENLYATDSPIAIEAGALQKDNQTGGILAQIKMKNISAKIIKV